MGKKHKPESALIAKEIKDIERDIVKIGRKADKQRKELQRSIDKCNRDILAANDKLNKKKAKLNKAIIKENTTHKDGKYSFVKVNKKTKSLPHKGVAMGDISTPASPVSAAVSPPPVATPIKKIKTNPTPAIGVIGGTTTPTT